MIRQYKVLYNAAVLQSPIDWKSILQTIEIILPASRMRSTRSSVSSYRWNYISVFDCCRALAIDLLINTTQLHHGQCNLYQLRNQSQ